LLFLLHILFEKYSRCARVEKIQCHVLDIHCRIDDKNQVKVADFGLSHQLFEREYYRSKDHKAKLPIKWMALESLEDFVFTAKSDVVCSLTLSSVPVYH